MPGYDHDPDDIDEIPKVSVIYRADKAEIKHAAPSYEFAADWMHRYSDDGENPPACRPSIFMPRWASRITLEVTGVRVERLQDISEADAIAEGVQDVTAMVALRDREFRFWRRYSGRGVNTLYTDNAIASYASLWTQINGPGSWDSNPWVWVVEFKKLGGAAP
jgi:hypothetical protein